MNSKRLTGAIAAGHSATAEAAAFALREGGNAFDAVIAAHWCACVAEPALASLGGGGFLLARPAAGKARVYDFFAQTPNNRRLQADIDFYPIHADFGTTQQEFHIGYGSAAVPGTVRGLFTIHRQLARLPMSVLMAPALELARSGMQVNELQAFILDIVRPVYLASKAATRCFGSQHDPQRLVQQGETLCLPELAETLQALAEEGDRLFYEGEVSAIIDALCRDHGGQLERQDLIDYQVITRAPLSLRYRNATLLTNPPPSSGGLLIGFALKLLERLDLRRTVIDSAAGLVRLAEVMRSTNEARLRAEAANLVDERLLDPQLLDHYLRDIAKRARAYRGTTHISVVDAAGNVAALSTSNGEGCGHMIGNMGFMLNNMLGEQDLCPSGFQCWQPNQRLTSMMAPSLLEMPDGGAVAFGSGGSNRIRSALLQTMLRMVDGNLALEDAIERPRMHYEDGLLSIESGFEAGVCKQLEKEFDSIKYWPDRNLYFGGVHAVRRTGNRFECHGDSRRGGVALLVS